MWVSELVQHWDGRVLSDQQLWSASYVVLTPQLSIQVVTSYQRFPILPPRRQFWENEHYVHVLSRHIFLASSRVDLTAGLTMTCLCCSLLWLFYIGVVISPLPQELSILFWVNTALGCSKELADTEQSLAPEAYKRKKRHTKAWSHFLASPSILSRQLALLTLLHAFWEALSRTHWGLLL